MADNSNKVEIKIDADGDSAVVTINRVRDSFKHFSDGVLSAARSVGRWVSAFSRINWIVASIQTVINLVRSLREWTQRAATAARELAERLRDESIATAAAHAAEAYKKLNKELAEANRLEKERNSILDRRKSAQRDIEDANLEFAKAREIAALDPSQEGYADAKAAIERKYER